MELQLLMVGVLFVVWGAVAMLYRPAGRLIRVTWLLAVVALLMLLAFNNMKD
jgi:hypothetical protein